MAGQPPDDPAARVDPNTAESPWSGVGAVTVHGAAYSGVAIGPRHVLTAAHVAGSDPAALSFIAHAGPRPDSYRVRRIARYPDFSFPYDDLAILELARELTPGIHRYALARSPLKAGRVITLVGYGASGNGDRGVSVAADPGVKRVGENTVDALARQIDRSGRSSAFYLYDFDGPSGSGPLGTGSLGNHRETLTAAGDSGSPAFVLEAGEWVVAGVNTFVTRAGGGRPGSYRFGSDGGGIDLGNPRFAAWLARVTGTAAPRAVGDARR